MYTLVPYLAALVVATLLTSYVLPSYILRVTLFTIIPFVGYAANAFGLWLAVIIALIPFMLSVLQAGYYLLIAKLALAGYMSDERQWMVELAVEGEDEYMQSLNQIDRDEVREALIIADNKHELQELVVERATESNNE